MRGSRLVAMMALGLACSAESPDPVVVGSKNFTESVILGELLAQQLERAGCNVDRKLNLGGTFVVDRAIRSGDVDAYVEYSGTALTAILDQETIPSRAEIRHRLERAYADDGLIWGPELGFENTFAMIVRRAYAEDHGVDTIGDLIRLQDSARPGFGYEFVERPDGWGGLLETYGLRFTEAPRTMDLGLTYRALAASEIDLIAGNSTDGLIEHLDLQVLTDDLDYFPPYDAVIVYSGKLGEICPAGPDALAELAGSLDASQMRRLNFAVDGEKASPASVVSGFLDSRD